MTTETKTDYSPSDWTEADTVEAKRLWEEYQRAHDVSVRKGQAAGIDPKTGEVWFGDSIMDISEKRGRQGLTSPLFFIRVGYPTYYRKGARR
jgi:hypothetical protein